MLHCRTRGKKLHIGKYATGSNQFLSFTRDLDKPVIVYNPHLRSSVRFLLNYYPLEYLRLSKKVTLIDSFSKARSLMDFIAFFHTCISIKEFMWF